MRGIEADPFAVRLARVSLWMGHKLAIDERIALGEVDYDPFAHLTPG